MYLYITKRTMAFTVEEGSGCFDKNCKQVISKDARKRLHGLFDSGKLTLSSSQRDLILSVGKTIPESDVIILSASSSNHYTEMQAMFENLHQIVYPRLTNFTMVLFDIGLSHEERVMTFDYFEDESCAFLPYPEIIGTSMLHKNDPLVIKAILEPWARCALEKTCMCPVNPKLVLGCKPNLKMHKCHRFDQSAITIIMANVYGEELYRFLSP